MIQFSPVEEYTKIRTPRQEMIFKKSSLDRKRDSIDQGSLDDSISGSGGSTYSIADGNSSKEVGKEDTKSNETAEDNASTCSTNDTNVTEENNTSSGPPTNSKEKTTRTEQPYHPQNIGMNFSVCYLTKIQNVEAFSHL